MARINFEGIDEYAKALETMYKNSDEIVKKAVYQGAAVVANEIKEGLKGLPIQEGKNGLPPVGTSENPLIGVSRRQKADLIEGFGLAPMENDNGYIQTKAGMNGYGSVKTKKYPKGVPNAVLMRSIESGASFRKKHPVFRPATNQARIKAQQAMDRSISQSMKEIFK